MADNEKCVNYDQNEHRLIEVIAENGQSCFIRSDVLAQFKAAQSFDHYEYLRAYKDSLPVDS